MGAEGGQRREGQKTPKSEGVEEVKADKSGKIKGTRAGGGGGGGKWAQKTGVGLGGYLR